MNTMLDPNRMLQLVEQHVRAENEHDIEGILETFGSEPCFDLNSMHINGRDGIRSLYEGFGFGGAGAFAGLRAETKNRHVTSNTIVLELLLSGEHVGNWQGIPATRRKFAVPACAVFTFDEAEKLASERVYFDTALLLQQLGVMESPDGER